MKVIKNSIDNVKFGQGVKIIDPVNLYKCYLDDEVFVGPFVEIQAGVKIGKKLKYNHIHLFVSLF